MGFREISMGVHGGSSEILICIKGVAKSFHMGLNGFERAIKRMPGKCQ